MGNFFAIHAELKDAIWTRDYSSFYSFDEENASACLLRAEKAILLLREKEFSRHDAVEIVQLLSEET